MTDHDEVEGEVWDGPVAICGAGAHGTDIAAIVRDNGAEAEFYDDDPAVGYPPCNEAPGNCIIGVYDPVVRAHLDPGDEGGFMVVSAGAWCDDSALAKPGLVVAAGAVLGNGVTIGRHVHVGQAASLVRCSVGDYSTISPGAVICGDVTIGSASLIGAGAVVSNLCTIGDAVVIGAGAVLPPRTVVPDGAVWVGNPARPLYVEDDE